MRFSKEDKIKMYRLYQKEYGYADVKKQYQISEGNYYYLINILKRHGIEWLDRPRHKWTKEEKFNAINRVLLGHETQGNVALDLGLSSSGAVANWIRIYQKMITI